MPRSMNMSISVRRAGQCDHVRTALEVVLSVLVVAAFSILTGCGTTSAKTQSRTPTEPSYPSVPPAPITWSPQTSPLPAPPAQVPPPSGSNDFPLTISSPTDGGTVTSPATVAASATPRTRSSLCGCTSTNWPSISLLQTPSILRFHSARSSYARGDGGRQPGIRLGDHPEHHG
jgi:hypothetical protein